MEDETARLVEARPRTLNARWETGEPWSIFSPISDMIKTVLSGNCLAAKLKN